MSQAETGDVKDAAHQLIDELPEGATWDDVMYRIYVRQAVEAGLRDAENGHVIEVAERFADNSVCEDIHVLAVVHGAHLLPPEPPLEGSV